MRGSPPARSLWVTAASRGPASAARMHAAERPAACTLAMGHPGIVAMGHPGVAAMGHPGIAAVGHRGVAASTKARITRTSSPISGCHCTPSTQPGVGSSSASTVPSAAYADGTRPSPRRSTAWWW